MAVSQETQAAFLRAAEILQELADRGIRHVSFELFVDASGTLWLGDPAVTQEHLQHAMNIVRSTRQTMRSGWHSGYGIDFCGGLHQKQGETS